MKYGMFSKGSSESSSHITMVEMPSMEQAEAYFAGRKQMTLKQFREIFLVREIKDTTKTILYGNR
mgnify:CR=1 FL=1|tara:strand:+ start:353 stop:547 length:195 start_codon:yes stop_codon:yes gene_type:complete